MQVLYLISDILYQVIYKIAGYRKRVVRSNLEKAFPNMHDEIRKNIEERFYRNFFDFIVETVKAASISDEELKKRMVFTNIDEIKDVLNGSSSALFLATHQFNWEWMQLSAALQFPIDISFIYHPLHHKGSDKMMLNLRSRFGATPVKRREFGRQVIKNRDKRMGYAMVADQLPANRDKKTWINFLNLETAFFQAIEQSAKLINGPVLFFKMIKVRRGYYYAKMEVLASGSEVDEGAVISKYAASLEKNIQEQPDGWLWSHKRWKRRKEQ